MSYWLETTIYVGTTRWDQGEAITFDGDGRTAKREKRSRLYAFPATGWNIEPEYYINSSVTGQKLIELDNAGARKQVNVYTGSTVIAEHTVGGTAFKHADPVTGSTMQTDSSGKIEPYDVGRVELEPLGAVLPTTEPELNGPPHDFGKGGSTSNPEGGCMWNGAPIPCSMISAISNVYSPRPVLGQSSAVSGASGESSISRPRTPPTLKVRTKEVIAAAKARAQEMLATNPNAFAEDAPDDLADRLEAAIDVVNKHVNFVSDSQGGEFERPENRKAVKSAIVWMLASRDCEQAFKDAGLPTPESVIKKRGLNLAGAGLLNNPSSAAKIGIEEESRRQAVIKSVNNVKVQAFTSDNAQGPKYTFYKNAAFSGSSYLSGYYSLEEVVVHEMIHAVGVGKYTSTFGGHDLSGYEHYSNILAKCRIDQ